MLSEEEKPPAEEEVVEGKPIKVKCYYCEEEHEYPAELGGKNAPCSPDYVYCRRDRDAQRNAAVVRADKKQRDLGEYMLNNPVRP